MNLETTSNPTDALATAPHLPSVAELSRLLFKLAALAANQPQLPTPAPRPPASPPPVRWVTPPVAHELTGLSVKTIRAWARAGRISARLRNSASAPKQLKYLVDVDEVMAASTLAAGCLPASRPVQFNAKTSLPAEATWAERKLARSSNG